MVSHQETPSHCAGDVSESSHPLSHIIYIQYMYEPWSIKLLLYMQIQKTEIIKSAVSISYYLSFLQ